MTAPQTITAGTIALDSIVTPFGRVTDVLGGSVPCAALAASLFSPTGVMAVIGKDFPSKYKKLLEERLDLKGVTTEEKTFRWGATYEYAMDAATTTDTQLGSLATWQPVVPQSYSGAKVLYIGNFDPKLQHRLLDWAHAQHPRPWLMLDTMNYWINNDREHLATAINRVDLLIVNDQEARMLTNNPNLIAAGQQLLKEGPQYVIIKKGEHGALVFSEEHFFAVPGFPLSELKDPTGAGDSFAGAIAGQIATKITDNTLPFIDLIKAVRCATVVASFTTESFSVDRLASLKPAEIEERLKEYSTFTQLASL